MSFARSGSRISARLGFPRDSGGEHVSRTLLLVGTRKGAVLLERTDLRDCSVRGPFCEGWPVEPAPPRLVPARALLPRLAGLSRDLRRGLRRDLRRRRERVARLGGLAQPGP